MPEYDAAGKETGRLLITLDAWAAIGAYTTEVRDWIRSASGCLDAR